MGNKSLEIMNKLPLTLNKKLHIQWFLLKIKFRDYIQFVHLPAKVENILILLLSYASYLLNVYWLVHVKMLQKEYTKLIIEPSPEKDEEDSANIL